MQFFRHTTLKGRLLAGVYALFSVLLFLYSYTQVDLGMTLTRVSVWQTLQQKFQYIGYFNRPLSTLLFLSLLAVFFVLYGITLRYIRKKQLNARDVWILIGVVAGITCLSYPAFSYDFFNYLFTAKTVLIYQKNPYIVTPLQFSGVESWLSFMHWTHLPSAYTPLWILYTLVPFILGFGYFLILMWNLKIFIAAAYLFTAWGIGKILEKENKTYALLGIAIFAFNPLIIIESLVSPHNDILMMALAIGSVIAYQHGKRWASWFILSLSIAMKLMTIFLIPAFFLKWNRKVALAGIAIGLCVVLFQREVLGWYWVWIVPFIALLPEKSWLTTISAGVSLGLLLRYAPFLYYGHWNDPVPVIKAWVTGIPVAVALISVLVSYILKKYSAVSRKSL
jgi:hypothetical protein